MLIASILAEILQTIKTSISLLYLVYKDKSFPCNYRLPRKCLECLHDTFHMKILLKQILHTLIVMTIDINQIFELVFAKLFKQPCFTHLTSTLKHQRLAVWIVFPIYQRII